MKYSYLCWLTSVHCATTACQTQGQIVCACLQSSLLDGKGLSHWAYFISPALPHNEWPTREWLTTCPSPVGFCLFHRPYWFSHRQSLTLCYCCADIMPGIQPILFCYLPSFLAVTTASGSVNSAFLHKEMRKLNSFHVINPELSMIPNRHKLCQVQQKPEVVNSNLRPQSS